MMPRSSKAKTACVCSDCGAEYPKWQGQRESCGEWNTLSAFVAQLACQQSGRWWKALQ